MANFSKALLAASLPILATATIARTQTEVPAPVRPLTEFLATPIHRVTVDGRLEEWAAREVGLRLGRAGQVWSQRQDPDSAVWGGEADLSAEIWFGYDAQHVYVAGRVRDDSIVRGSRDKPWHEQDAVEVFLDLRPDRSEPLEDAVHLFVMPFSSERPWGVVDWPSNRPSGASLIGVRAASELAGDGSYTFELVFPVANSSAYLPVTRVGFDLAIDDHDEGTERYQYMTVTGRNPTRQPELSCELVFDGSFVPGVIDGSGGSATVISSWLQTNAWFLLLPLAAILGLFVLLRAWGALERAAPRLRPVGRAGGVLLFALGLLLPGFLTELRHERHEAELGDALTHLTDNLAGMAEGVLGSYGGEERDAALATLLDGGPIAREQRYSYTSLSDVVDNGEPVPRPVDLNYAVRPYGIDLDADSVERFEFRESIPPGNLNVTVARPRLPFAGREPPSLLVTTFGVDGSIGSQERLVCSGTYYGVPEVARPDYEVSFRTLAIQRELRAVTISEPLGDGLQLVGLTWASADGTQERALPLGEPSLGGVETELRRGHPAHAGFEIAAGSSYPIEFADTAEAADFDRLWLFFRGTYLGRPNVDRPGDTVCELRVWERDRREARLIEFRHQESMFFELEFQNQEVPDDADVAIGMRWIDDAQEPRVTMVREIDLRADLGRLEFRNVGGYPIRFRALVFGREVKSIGVSRPDSPLERLPGTGEERLRDEVRARLGAARVGVYRNGRMTATTLEPARRAAHANLPVEVRRAPLTKNAFQRVPVAESSRGAAEYVAYASLAGGGTGEWGGAVLGVFLEDPGAADYAKNVHRVGTVLSLLALPILLHTFSQLLALLRSLRLRLITLFAVVLLLPLGVVSFLLADVLEEGHGNDLRRRLGQAIDGVNEGVSLQGRELRDAASTWVQDLAEQVVAAAEFQGVREGEDAERPFRQLMLSQRPPGWDETGGSLLFEFDPDPERSPAGLSSIRAFVGPDELSAMSTPLRSEPGVYVAWSVPFLGVRADADTPYGSCSLSVVRRLDQSFLRTLANDRGIVLCGMNGYPLDVSGGGPGALTPDDLRSHGVQPSVTAARATAAQAVVDGGGRPVVRVHPATPASGGDAWFAIYDVIADLQDTPRALVGLVERYEGATLPLAIGRVPLRAFLVTAAIVLLGASLFLGWVMTTRITTPIARLERGARALSQGEFDVHVDAEEERGQIGQLTHAFNQMAMDLRGRIQDLRALNRGIRDLTSRLDLAEVMASAVAFYTRNTPADRVRILVLDRERDRVEVFGGEQRELIDGRPADVQSLLRTGGALSARLGSEPGGVSAGGELARRFAGHRSAVVLPLVIGERARGAVFLLFESDVPEEIHLELHSTMAVQITAAIDNAWLYRHAVEDLHTGAYRPDFFRARVARAIAEPTPVLDEDGADGASTTGEAVAQIAVVALRLVDGEALAVASGDAPHGRLLERLLAEMRAVLGADAEFCREGDAELRALVRVRDPAGDSLDARVRELRSRAWAVRFDLPTPFTELRVVTASARYPDDAASAEFLFEELGERLARAVQGDPVESGERASASAAGAAGAAAESPAMAAVYRVLERVAPTDITLLIEGETGVGKEVLTDRVHSISKRANGPLVKVHCAALPESLLQSELFGHEKGAFTGAHERVIGRFEQADGGTIFLDEIGEISLDVQVQLLRVLQEREIERVGSGRKIPVDVRVIAATNRDMRQLVADGRFREDLYYRLQGMVVVVPPLRERRAEIAGLVEVFRREAVAAGDTRVVGFSPAMMDDLFRRDWPGNIRELRNVVFRAMVLAGDGVVDRGDLKGDRASAVEPTPRPDPDPSSPGPPDVPERPPSEISKGPASDRLVKLRALVASKGSISSTEYAAAAGLSPRTALRDLNRLQESGILAREGRRRGARYRLANPPESSP